MKKMGYSHRNVRAYDAALVAILTAWSHPITLEFAAWLNGDELDNDAKG
jgi:hypothetical protein